MTEPPFIRCDHSTTEGYKTTPYFIRVVLNPDVKIYSHEYNGIEFFVCRDVVNGSRNWKATEVNSGACLQTNPYTTYHTKKECVKIAEDVIYRIGTERLRELVDFIVEKHPFDDVMTQDAYMEFMAQKED